jgi:predicted MFS family arabinose efflux permease
MHTTADFRMAEAASPWGAVVCMSLMCFTLVAAEFMPVAMLTPIAGDLGVSEGRAGQVIAISGFFAVATSLFGNSLLGRLDRRNVILLYTAILVVSGLATAFAPTYLVFMLGRALLGVAVGGFWSLSTAVIARIVPPSDLPRAIALLQGGAAFASVIGAPLGSFLGDLIGWRGAFFLVVPVGIAALLWQLVVLPSLPAGRGAPLGRMAGLARNRVFVIGMAAMTLGFMGRFALFTYLRPFLEGVTGFDIEALSFVLLALGLAGLLGTFLIGVLVHARLNFVLVGLPAVLAVIALLLIPLAPYAGAVAVLLVLWGLFTTPMPVAWNTWMTRAIPGELEAGGGLQVALIQFATTFGAFTGGMLFDAAGWWSPFAFGALLLLGAALLSTSAARSVPTA